MASAAPALALKAAALVAVLAVLVMPSLGRCPSLRPENPPPPAPAPAPAPVISCSDCRERCDSTSTCNDYATTACSSVCNAPPSAHSAAACDACSAQEGLGGDQCMECSKQTLKCPNCTKSSYFACMGDCHRQCDATCV